MIHTISFLGNSVASPGAWNERWWHSAEAPRTSVSVSQGKPTKLVFPQDKLWIVLITLKSGFLPVVNKWSVFHGTARRERKNAIASGWKQDRVSHVSPPGWLTCMINTKRSGWGWARWNWSLNTWSMHAIDGGKHKLLALWHPPTPPRNTPLQPPTHPQSFHPLVVRCRVYPQCTWVFSPVCSSSVLFGSQLNADSHPSFNVSSWWWQEWPSLQKSWPRSQLTPFRGLVGGPDRICQQCTSGVSFKGC